MEAIRFETTVGKGGTLKIPDLVQGEQVEVIVLRKPKSPSQATWKMFAGGWAKGKIHVLPGFDDPIPGMEEYM